MKPFQVIRQFPDGTAAVVSYFDSRDEADAYVAVVPLEEGEQMLIVQSLMYQVWGVVRGTEQQLVGRYYAEAQAVEAAQNAGSPFAYVERACTGGWQRVWETPRFALYRDATLMSIFSTIPAALAFITQSQPGAYRVLDLSANGDVVWQSPSLEEVNARP